MIGSFSRGRWCASALVFMVVVCGTLQAIPARLPREPSRPPITAATAGQVRELAQLADDVWRIVWRADGRELALVRWEQPVEIVDGETFRSSRTLGQDKKIIHFAFHPNPRVFAFCENAMHVEITGLDTRQAIRLDDGSHQPDVKFSPDGKLLASAGYGTTAKLWSVPEGKLVRALNVGDVKGGLTVEFSPDGSVLAVGNRNAHTCLFEVATGKLIRTLNRAMSHGLRFNPAGNMLAVAYVDGSLAVWEVATGKQGHLIKTDAAELYTVDWSPNGEVLVTAGLKGAITLWNARDLSKLKELNAGDWIIQARFSPDGSRLVSAGGDQDGGGRRSLRVWGLPTDWVGALRK
jgi:WD40 repeat protein